MALLSPDQVEGVHAAIGNMGGVSAPTPAPAPQVPETTPSSPPTDVKAQEVSNSESKASVPPAQPSGKKASGKPDTGQKVPYGRFKNVVDARNQFKSQLDRSRSSLSAKDAEIAELKRQLETMSRTPAAPTPVAETRPSAKSSSDSSWLDEILGVSESDTEAPEVDKFAEMQQGFQQRLEEQQKSFDTRMHQYEVAQAQRKLESEIATVRSRYPSLQAKDLAQLVINDPSVDLMESAETFMTYKAAIEEQAINRYLRENPHLTRQEKQQVVEAASEAASQAASAQMGAPTAPPRPAGSRSSAAGVDSAQVERPKTLREVKLALAERFAKNNPFSR